MATINISTTAQLIAAIGTGPGSAQDGDTLSFAAGDYTGVAIDISDGRDLTFVSANAGVIPTTGSTRPATDRIVSTGSITVDGIHVHATLGGDAPTTAPTVLTGRRSAPPRPAPMSRS